LAAAPQHRAPRRHAGHLGFHGAGLRGRRQARCQQGEHGLLGETCAGASRQSGLTKGIIMLIGHEASWLDAAGRVLIALFFLWVTITNLSAARIKDHIERLTLYKAPQPAALFW